MTASEFAGTDLRVAVLPTPVDLDKRPKSAIPASDGLAGLVGLGLAWIAVMLLRPPEIVAAWLVLLATAAPLLIVELRRLPAAVEERQKFGPIAWIVGFGLALMPVLLVHGLGEGLWPWLDGWLIVTPAFLLKMLLQARRSGSVPGGFPLALGRALLPPDRVALRKLAAPGRLWALKAFFIPLYGLSLHGLIVIAFATDLSAPFGWLILLVTFAFTIDLGFGLSGYVFAASEIVPVRSTQTLWFGWLVCMLCYAPAFSQWPQFATVAHLEIGWPAAVAADATLLVAAALMVALLVLYVWATVAFGLRFCNLSNRGLIAHGPYRYMKHPAYFAHAVNSWIITLVFLPAAGIGVGLPQLLVPVAFTVLYSLRSLTEERHMSEDPAYVAYAGWIARHGLVARLRGLILRPSA